MLTASCYLCRRPSPQDRRSEQNLRSETSPWCMPCLLVTAAFSAVYEPECSQLLRPSFGTGLYFQSPFKKKQIYFIFIYLYLLCVLCGVALRDQKMASDLLSGSYNQLWAFQHRCWEPNSIPLLKQQIPDHWFITTSPTQSLSSNCLVTLFEYGTSAALNLRQCIL